MSDKQRSADLILAGIAKFERKFNTAITEKLNTTLTVYVKIEEGRIDVVRVSENEDLRPAR